jgi:hypothetical protein
LKVGEKREQGKERKREKGSKNTSSLRHAMEQREELRRTSKDNDQKKRVGKKCRREKERKEISGNSKGTCYILPLLRTYSLR